MNRIRKRAKNSSTPDLTQNQFDKKNSSNSWTKRYSAVQKKYFYSLRAIWGLVVNVKINKRSCLLLAITATSSCLFSTDRQINYCLRCFMHKPNKFKPNFNYKPLFHWFAVAGYELMSPLKRQSRAFLVYLSLVSSVKDYWRKIDFSWMVKYQCEQDSKEQPGSAEMLGAPRYSQ